MSTLVSSEAPAIRAKAVLHDDSVREDFSLADLRGRYVVLFFYPFDFSVVCPSELLALDSRIEKFRERECEVVGVSVDSHFTHLAWKKTAVANGGIGPIRFTLVADLTKQISRDYGVLSDEGFALRATFLIDREGIVRHQTVNDTDVGRRIEDTLRTLDALRLVERTGKLCPADWEEGGESVEAPPAGVVRYPIDFRFGS
ncbi:MAG: peroxiredoxin [Gemmatimonadales bacterium]|jgi:peroxiredoxin (alkyl hydroperoxide reductase subunit C)